jgi:hypothetical protein
MWRAIVMLGAIGLIGFIGFRTLFGGQTVSWHQRLTVIVDTPNGEVRGASVTEVTNTETMGALLPMESRGVHSVVRGEAVAVEVLPGRWLFALLSGDDDALGQADQLIYTTFRLGENLNVSDRTYEALMADLRSKPLDTPAPVPAESYPLLVTFDDITKPETVREVDPADMAATFGPGVRLDGMTLEVTDVGVTEGTVDKVLNWIGPNEKSSFSGLDFFDPSRPNPLNYLPKNTLKQD